MKKIVLTLLILIVAVVGVVAGLVFTKAGNEMLRPYIEAQLQKNLPIGVKLERFTISPADIALMLEDGSYVKVNGELSLLRQSFDLRYDVHIKDLATLKPLTNAELRGPFATQGTVKGDLKAFDVEGKSDVAKSSTNYKVQIENLEPKSVIASVQKASVAELLYMVNQPRFVQGALNVDAKLTDLDPEHLKGNLLAKLENGVVDRKLLKKSFGVELPQTTIASETKVNLEGKQVVLDSKTDSNLLKLLINGIVKTDEMATDLNYDLKIARLELLKPVTNAPLRGSFATKGKIVGNEEKMVIQGSSDVAGSDTGYKVELAHYQPKSLHATIKNAKLAKILYMVEQPHYADAIVNSTISLTSLDPNNLRGAVETKVRNGVTDPKVLKKEFDLANAKIRFEADQKTSLEGTVAVSDVAVRSSVANVTTTKAKFYLPSGKLEAPFVAVIPDLNKLYFVTKQHMKGKLKITGEVKKDKDLIVTAHSDTLGGSVDAKLVNDDLKADVKGVQFTELTDMLLYPRVFTSTLNATLNYNIATKKGKLLANALDGRILPNKMSFLLQQMANFDITKEVYKKTTLTSNINDKVIVSDLDMQSRLTHITSKGAVLDLNKEYVNAKLAIDIKGKPVYVKIKGKLKSPNVSLGAGSIMKERAKKAIEKKLEKNLKGKLPGDAGKLLNNLF